MPRFDWFGCLVTALVTTTLSITVTTTHVQAFHNCPSFVAPKHGHVVCDDLIGAFCSPVCQAGYRHVSVPAKAYICNPISKKWTTYPAGHKLPWPDCTKDSPKLVASRTQVPFPSASQLQHQRGSSLWNKIMRITTDYKKELSFNKKPLNVAANAYKASLTNHYDQIRLGEAQKKQVVTNSIRSALQKSFLKLHPIQPRFWNGYSPSPSGNKPQQSFYYVKPNFKRPADVTTPTVRQLQMLTNSLQPPSRQLQQSPLVAAIPAGSAWSKLAQHTEPSIATSRMSLPLGTNAKSELNQMKLSYPSSYQISSSNGLSLNAHALPGMGRQSIPSSNLPLSPQLNAMASTVDPQPVGSHGDEGDSLSLNTDNDAAVVEPMLPQTLYITTTIPTTTAATTTAATTTATTTTPTPRVPTTVTSAVVMVTQPEPNVNENVTPVNPNESNQQLTFEKPVLPRPLPESKSNENAIPVNTSEPNEQLVLQKLAFPRPEPESKSNENATPENPSEPNEQLVLQKPALPLPQQEPKVNDNVFPEYPNQQNEQLTLQKPLLPNNSIPASQLIGLVANGVSTTSLPVTTTVSTTPIPLAETIKPALQQQVERPLDLKMPFDTTPAVTYSTTKALTTTTATKSIAPDPKAQNGGMQNLQEWVNAHSVSAKWPTENSTLLTGTVASATPVQELPHSLNTAHRVDDNADILASIPILQSTRGDLISKNPMEAVLSTSTVNKNDSRNDALVIQHGDNRTAQLQAVEATSKTNEENVNLTKAMLNSQQENVTPQQLTAAPLFPSTKQAQTEDLHSEREASTENDRHLEAAPANDTVSPKDVAMTNSSGQMTETYSQTSAAATGKHDIPASSLVPLTPVATATATANHQEGNEYVDTETILGSVIENDLSSAPRSEETAKKDLDVVEALLQKEIRQKPVVSSYHPPAVTRDYDVNRDVSRSKQSVLNALIASKHKMTPKKRIQVNDLGAEQPTQLRPGLDTSGQNRGNIVSSSGSTRDTANNTYLLSMLNQSVANMAKQNYSTPTINNTASNVTESVQQNSSKSSSSLSVETVEKEKKKAHLKWVAKRLLKTLAYAKRLLESKEMMGTKKMAVEHINKGKSSGGKKSKSGSKAKKKAKKQSVKKPKHIDSNPLPKFRG